MSTAAFCQKALLDWMLGGASPTRPTAWWAGLAIGSPTQLSASEATASGYARKTASFAAATTTGGSGFASNTVAFTFGTFSAVQTVSGIHVWNSSAGGTMLAYGLLSAASVMSSGDTLAFSSGAMTVKMV